MREGMGNCVHYRLFTEMAAVMSGESLAGMQVVALDLFDEGAMCQSFELGSSCSFCRPMTMCM
jgi:hypothetical protein